MEAIKNMSASCPFGDFLASKTQKRTAKGHAAFFLSAKRMPKRHQKVANAKRTAKSHGTCIQLYYMRLMLGFTDIILEDKVYIADDGTA